MREDDVGDKSLEGVRELVVAEEGVRLLVCIPLSVKLGVVLELNVGNDVIDSVDACVGDTDERVDAVDSMLAPKLLNDEGVSKADGD